MHDVDEEPNIRLRVSDTVAFEGCKRKWWWEKNYDTALFKDYFFIGTGVHAGLAGYYMNNRSRDAAQLAIDAWAHEARRTFEDTYRQRWSEVDADSHVALINGMVDHYCLFDAENHLYGGIVEDDDGPVVERRLDVQILDEEGRPILDHQHRPVYLSGKCDLGLVRNGQLYIVDHKTFGARTLADNPRAGLDVDDQVTAYAYLAWRTWGVIPAGVIYNIVAKEVPTPPRLVRAGAALSIDKSQPTTAALFRDAMHTYGFKATPEYLNFLRFLETNGDTRFVQRWVSTRNVHELRAFERRLAVKARDILRLIENPDVFAYASGSSYRCGNCPFVAPCKARDDGGDALSILDNYAPKTLWTIDE